VSIRVVGDCNVTVGPKTVNDASAGGSRRVELALISDSPLADADPSQSSSVSIPERHLEQRPETQRAKIICQRRGTLHCPLALNHTGLNCRFRLFLTKYGIAQRSPKGGMR
jgi:hypothetical protein